MAAGGGRMRERLWRWVVVVALVLLLVPRAAYACPS
jgi:hypothetical protein